MSLPGLLVSLAVLAGGLGVAEAFPTFLSCDRAFGPDNVIMAGPAVLSTERSAVFVRDGIEVDCGGTYAPGETLVGKLSSFEGGDRYLMQVIGGRFESGGCEGEYTCGGARCGKSTAEGQAIVAPMDGSALELTIGWTAEASGWGLVRFTETCRLVVGGTATAFPTWIEQEERLLFENETATLVPSMMPSSANGTNMTMNTTMPTPMPTMNMTFDNMSTASPTFMEEMNEMSAMFDMFDGMNETATPTMMPTFNFTLNFTDDMMNYTR